MVGFSDHWLSQEMWSFHPLLTQNFVPIFFSFNDDSIKIKFIYFHLNHSRYIFRSFTPNGSQKEVSDDTFLFEAVNFAEKGKRYFTPFTGPQGPRGP